MKCLSDKIFCVMTGPGLTERFLVLVTSYSSWYFLKVKLYFNGSHEVWSFLKFFWKELFVCLFFVCFLLLLFCFSVVWLLFGCRSIMNGWDYLKWTDFYVDQILIRFSFANEDLNMLHVTVFANILQYNLMLNLYCFGQITKFCVDLISKNC